MRPTRRDWLKRQALSATAIAWTPLALCACAHAPDDAADRIMDAATGMPLSGTEVVRRMRRADVVMLGELHDNPRHHVARAHLVRDLGGQVTVVAEHLPMGAAPALGVTDPALLLQQLQAQGFDAQGWRWPLHQPVFQAVAQAGHRLRGGNLARELARRLAREGVAAMPPEWRSWVDSAPLDDDARRALEDDLLQGHCGRLDAARLPGMVAAQRGRDAAMASVLVAELDRQRQAGHTGPVVLLAGNGHVRRDYGVPALLAPRRPALRLLSVGFTEQGRDPPGPRVPFDIVWRTPAVPREDPCASLAMGRRVAAVSTNLWM